MMRYLLFVNIFLMCSFSCTQNEDISTLDHSSTIELDRLAFKYMADNLKLAYAIGNCKGIDRNLLFNSKDSFSEEYLMNHYKCLGFNSSKNLLKTLESIATLKSKLSDRINGMNYEEVQELFASVLDKTYVSGIENRSDEQQCENELRECREQAAATYSADLLNCDTSGPGIPNLPTPLGNNCEQNAFDQYESSLDVCDRIFDDCIEACCPPPPNPPNPDFELPNTGGTGGLGGFGTCSISFDFGDTSDGPGGSYTFENCGG